MLKIKFWRVENVVLMKVLEQGDEIKRNCGEIYKDPYTEISIWSEDCPRIYSNAISIQGSFKDCDELVVCQQFSSIFNAENFYKKAIQTVQDYNSSCSRKKSPVVEGYLAM